VPLLFWTHPPDARLLLLAGVLGSWAAERAVLQQCPLLHRLLAGSAPTPAALLGAAHGVKLGVRLVVMGGTLAAVLWLLATRRAAELRREAVFLAIQRSVSGHRGAWG
jgi:hypothetical protein